MGMSIEQYKTLLVYSTVGKVEVFKFIGLTCHNHSLVSFTLPLPYLPMGGIDSAFKTFRQST